MRIKLLDRDDFRRYGKNIVDVPNHIAMQMIQMGKAIEIRDPNPNKKHFFTPPEDKAIWIPPEEKMMELSRQSIPKRSIERIPGRGDFLFPKSIIN